MSDKENLWVPGEDGTFVLKQKNDVPDHCKVQGYRLPYAEYERFHAIARDRGISPYTLSQEVLKRWLAIDDKSTAYGLLLATDEPTHSTNISYRLTKKYYDALNESAIALSLTRSKLAEMIVRGWLNALKNKEKSNG